MQSKLKKLYTQISAENSQMTEDKIFVKVFGPERSSRVRGYGDGVTPKELWGPSSSSSSTVNELRRQLEESKQRQEESEQRSAAEVQGLKEQLGRVEGLLSAQMNRFEGLLVQLTSHMHSPAQIERRTEISPSRNGVESTQDTMEPYDQGKVHFKGSQLKQKTRKGHGRRHKSNCLCAICVLKRSRREREENARIAKGQHGASDNNLTHELKQEDVTIK